MLELGTRRFVRGASNGCLTVIGADGKVDLSILMDGNMAFEAGDFIL